LTAAAAAWKTPCWSCLLKSVTYGSTCSAPGQLRRRVKPRPTKAADPLAPGACLSQPERSAQQARLGLLGRRAQQSQRQRVVRPTVEGEGCSLKKQSGLRQSALEGSSLERT
jgi:hypothetical protein